MATILVFKILRWFSQLLHQFCDSRSAIYMAHNTTFHERSKHIELTCHVIREKISMTIHTLTHVPSCSQIADMFTESLHFIAFFDFLSKLNLCSIHSPTWGDVLMCIISVKMAVLLFSLFIGVIIHMSTYSSKCNNQFYSIQ
jgi:hypothetical protein